VTQILFTDRYRADCGDNTPYDRFLSSLLRQYHAATYLSARLTFKSHILLPMTISPDASKTAFIDEHAVKTIDLPQSH
jgi:hypothetical protein